MYSTQKASVGYPPDFEKEQLEQNKGKQRNEYDELTNAMKEMGIMKTFKISKIFILGNKIVLKA